MPRKGRDLEKLTAILEEHLSLHGIQVTSPDYIRGRKSNSNREVDISLRSRIGSAEILIIVECRDRQGVEDVTWLEQLAKKREDVKADKAIAVSSVGFTSGAANIAQAEGIELRTMEEVDPAEMLLWFEAREMTAFVYSVNFSHVSINLVSPDKADIEYDINEIERPNFDINTPIFQRKRDRSQSSFMDIWGNFRREELYDDITPNEPKFTRRFHLEFPKEADRFQLVTASGPIEIASIDVVAELWIDVEKKPLSAVRVYRDDKNTIAQSAEFGFEHMGKRVSLGLHRYVDSGEQFVSVRTREEDKVKVNLNLVSINELVRQRLEKVAKDRRTVTYSELSKVNMADQQITLDRTTLDDVLSSISAQEHEAGRPLLSAIVVSASDKQPDEEFFALAKQLELYDGQNGLAFHIEEMRRVHDFWESDNY